MSKDVDYYKLNGTPRLHRLVSPSLNLEGTSKSNQDHVEGVSRNLNLEAETLVEVKVYSKNNFHLNLLKNARQLHVALFTSLLTSSTVIDTTYGVLLTLVSGVILASTILLNTAVYLYITNYSVSIYALSIKGNFARQPRLIAFIFHFQIAAGSIVTTDVNGSVECNIKPGVFPSIKPTLSKRLWEIADNENKKNGNFTAIVYEILVHWLTLLSMRTSSSATQLRMTCCV